MFNVSFYSIGKLLDYFYDQREALVDSSYFQKLSQLIADLKQFYVDLGDADVMSKMGQHLRDAASLGLFGFRRNPRRAVAFRSIGIGAAAFPIFFTQLIPRRAQCRKGGLGRQGFVGDWWH